jgi:FkbM family methyltransferase
MDNRYTRAGLRTLWRTASNSDKGNFFEYVIEGLIEKYCVKGSVAVDAGANYGAHTATMLNAVGPTGNVFAFEPHPKMAESLRGWQRNSPALTVVQKALANKAGAATFIIADEDGYGSIVERPQVGFKATERIEVELTTLDDEFSGSVDFIKADVEGAEIAMLNGALNILRRAAPMVVMELDWTLSFHGEKEAADEFVKLLDSLDYVVCDCFGMRITTLDVEAWNVILIPKKRTTLGEVNTFCEARAREFFSSKLGWNPYQKFVPA